MKRKHILIQAVITVLLALVGLTMMTGCVAARPRPQKKYLELPDRFTKRDLNAALQLGRQFLIERGLPNCSKIYKPAEQFEMEEAGKCWLPALCSKLTSPIFREAFKCTPLPQLQKGACDRKVATEALKKCNEKCGKITDSKEREECIVDFQ